MYQIHAVRTDTLEVLKEIRQIRFFDEFILVGGTALAMHFGHRLSIDLDLFSVQHINFDAVDLYLNKIEKSQLTYTSKSIKVFSVKGVKVDFVNYPNGWLKAPEEAEGFWIASVDDIAAMKIHAITNRGNIKDFVDLYFLLEVFSPNKLLELYQQKYPSSSLFLAVKSLLYFEDAEKQTMPQMIKPLTWNQMRLKVEQAFSPFL
ncbi:MAG: hypothetical protein C0424_01265 [Sphingobacteriaceae bacterium]|nr:hypothetical protein [Sphingobacteriaceae bacterium]